jgi:hypothetical protein
MKLITLLLTTFLCTFLSTSAYSDHHGNVPVGSGAFVALMVQAQDPDAYDYPGQMFIYNAFDSIEEAMAATDKYDPMKTTPELTAIREVQYTVMFKPLKQFTLEPGSERLWRLNISNQNLQPFTKKIVELETALRAAGHKVNLGIFQPIGGGVHETIHLRAVSPSYGESGKIIDDAFADADWINTWQEALALVDEVRSDNFEQCELIYTAE